MRISAALTLLPFLLLLPCCDRHPAAAPTDPPPLPDEPATTSSEERVVHSLEELQRLIPEVGEGMAPDGAVPRQIPSVGAAPVTPSRPAAATIEIATHCDAQADPSTARFITFNPMLAGAITEGACYLAGGRGGTLAPHSDLASRLALDLDGRWCGREAGDLERAVLQPISLYLRLPETSSSVVVRTREMRGTVEGGDFLPEAFTEWRVLYSDRLDGRVLVLDVEDVRGGATNWVQLEVAIEGGPSRAADLTWPAGCQL